MNKIKKIMRMLVMFILILCGILGFILSKNEKTNTEIYDEMSYSEEISDFEMDYQIVSECIEKYEDILMSLNNVTDVQEKNQLINLLYNITTKEYIDKYNITKENLLNNLIVNNLQDEFSIISISKIEGNVNKYHTYVQVNKNGEQKQIDIIVFLDEKNKTFSIMQEYIQETPTRTYEEIIFVSEQIEKNDDNSYIESQNKYYIDSEGGSEDAFDESKVQEKQVQVQVIALSEPKKYNAEYTVTQDFDDAGWTTSKAIVEEYGPVLNINTMSNYYSKGNAQEYEAFMSSLGGLFAKYAGEDKKGTGDAQSLIEAQEFVYSTLWMVGFDYCAKTGGNSSYDWSRCTSFRRKEKTNIYSAYPDLSYDTTPHHGKENCTKQLYNCMINYNFTTNCNYTVDKVFYEAGLFGGEGQPTGSHNGSTLINNYGGKKITDISDLHFGDIIECYNDSDFSSWYHVMYVGEETQDTITIYQTGHDFVDDGNWRVVLSKDADNSEMPATYWYGIHLWDLEYDPSLVNGYGAGTTTDDEGNLLLNALINLLTTILDAIQTFVTKIMTGVSLEQAAVLIEDTSVFPNLDLQVFDDGESWLENKNQTEDEEISSEGMDTSGEGVLSEENGKIQYYVDASTYKKNYKYVNMAYSPEEIFSNQIDLLSVNFFETTNQSGIWGTLRNTIAYWFRALRYIGLVGLLSVLIYMGIKIMITSSASQKADFKQAFLSWIIGIVIMFLLPYIMSFILTIGTKLTEIFVSPDTTDSVEVYVYDGGVHEDKSTYSKFSTNLMGLVRFQSQNNNTSKRIGFVLMYLMLIITTIRFTIMYFKRMIYMAYLTMISPIVALMYPLDKANGGGAESFNEWIKGYSINAFIQPIHLLAYYILVSSAMTFATDNLLYTIVALGFISQLEHIIRQIFGLGEGGGMGAVGGLEDTALGMSSIANTVTNVASMIGNNISKNKENSKNNKPRMQDSSNNNEVDYSRDFNANNGNQTEGLGDANSNDEGQNADEESSSSQNSNQTTDNTDENNSSSNEPDNADDNNNNGENSDENSDEEDNDSSSGKDENTTGKKSSKGADSKTADEGSVNKETKARLKGKKGAIRKMAEKRLFKAGYNMGYRKGQGLKQNAKNIAKKAGKKAIKGVKKGVKIGGALTIGAGAALGQAAISLADGKYSPMEAFGTIAAVGAGANKLMDSAGKKLGELGKEYKQLKTGNKEFKKQQRVNDFRNSKEAYNLYEKEYMPKGSSEMANRLGLGEKIAAGGIVRPSEQIEVMNYIDSMVDKDFKKTYGSMSKSQREAEAAKIQSKNKALEGMDTDEVLKWNMRNEGKYVDTAVTTAKARKEIPADKINATDKEWNSYVASMSAGDTNTIKGYNQARTNIRAMNAAQRKKKK